jgi:hypothetical protein
MALFNRNNPLAKRGGSANLLQDFFRRYTFLSLLALSVVAGIMFGATVAYQASMTEEAQQVAALANYRPNLVTRVLADDGKTVVGEFLRSNPRTHEGSDLGHRRRPLLPAHRR